VRSPTLYSRLTREQRAGDSSSAHSSDYNLCVEISCTRVSGSLRDTAHHGVEAVTPNRLSRVLHSTGLNMAVVIMDTKTGPIGENRVW